MNTIRLLSGHRGFAPGVQMATRLLLGAIALFVFTAAVRCWAEDVAATQAGGLPRYQFKVGQEIHYTSNSNLQYENNSIKRSTDWKIWVARKNDDGSWRLIVKSVDGQGDENAPLDDSRSRLSYVDLFPDGRCGENATIGTSFEPRKVFVRLPADATELKNGWQARTDVNDTSFNYMAKPADEDAVKLWQFSCVQDSPFNKIYVSSQEDEIVFDAERGIVREIQGKSTQKWGINGKGTSQLTLKDVSDGKADWIASLDRDFQRYLATAKQDEALSEAAERAAAPEPLLDEVKQLWTKLRGEITNDEVVKVIDGRIRQEDSYRQYRIDDAKKRAEVVGKPAAAWETTDLDGKPNRLADHAGKVVVLDFWYRGCGWCIRAMPQVNQVAEDFAGQPVAVLGMNTDSEIEDAKFVDEAMKLTYKSLRVDNEFPKKYGVSGFPTFIVIDGAGRVCDMHVGYSPNLREKLTASIRDALKNSPKTSSPGGNSQ